MENNSDTESVTKGEWNFKLHYKRKHKSSAVQCKCWRTVSSFYYATTDIISGMKARMKAKQKSWKLRRKKKNTWKLFEASLFLYFNVEFAWWKFFLLRCRFVLDSSLLLLFGFQKRKIRKIKPCFGTWNVRWTEKKWKSKEINNKKRENIIFWIHTENWLHNKTTTYKNKKKKLK